MGKCAVCGGEKEHHHRFKPIKTPEGCVCVVEEWGNPNDIPPVCKKFKGTIEDYCVTCEHEKECHK